MRKVMLGTLFVLFVAVESYGIEIKHHLDGEFPVGRWECWFEHSDYQKTATAVSGVVPWRCQTVLMSATVLELLPDGYGWLLAIETPKGFHTSSDTEYDPDKSFRIAGSPRRFSVATEIRWRLDDDQGDWKACADPRADGCLVITTNRHRRFSFEKISHDVIRLTDTYYGTLRLLFRTGSTPSRQMVQFRDCVIGNKGVALFNVTECSNPVPEEGRWPRNGEPHPRRKG